MKIALVHDDLIQWGGAEKVFTEISNIFPDAPIYTTVADFKNPFISTNFKGKTIITSFLQKIPFLGFFYKPLAFLHPIAFEQFDFSEYDLVISHTTRFAKSIITKPETKHICYIHTPPRFLWNYNKNKTSWIEKILFSKLKVFDFISSKRVDYWIAGSKNCQKRLKETYDVASSVLYPFVDLDEYNPEKSFDGNYYLIVGRLNKYKKHQLVLEAFRRSGRKLKIVGSGPLLGWLKESAPSNVQILGSVRDELLMSLLSGCKGLIIAGDEDFGMTAIEAQAFGKGIICYGKGGVLETVINDKTGIYFYEQTAASLNLAIDTFEAMKILPEDCYENAAKFSKKNFKRELLELISEYLK